MRATCGGLIWGCPLSIAMRHLSHGMTAGLDFEGRVSCVLTMSATDGRSLKNINPLGVKMNIKKRNAFTLVELLVVIAIIGILMGLLLPAVQQVREAARRTECSNNIRQLGLALHNFESAHRHLPTGWQVDELPTGLTGLGEEGLPGWGWATKILPYLEQGNVHRQFDFSLALDDEAFESTREHVIATFLCPSDPSDEVMPWDWIAEEFDHDHPHDPFAPGPFAPGLIGDDGHDHDDLYVSRCNYSGVFGSLEIEGNEDRGDGLFFRNSKIRFKNITDGLSNTLMCGERLGTRGTVTWVGADPHIEEGPARIVGVTDHLLNDEEHGHFEDFASAHPQGALFLSADGSVRLMPDFVDEELYRALSTRSGGEVTGIWD